MADPVFKLQFTTWPHYHITYYLKIEILNQGTGTIGGIAAKGYRAEGNLLFEFLNRPNPIPVGQPPGHAQSSTSHVNKWQWIWGIPGVYISAPGPFEVYYNYFTTDDIGVYYENTQTYEYFPGPHTVNSPQLIKVSVPQAKRTWAVKALAEYLIGYSCFFWAGVYGAAWWISIPLAIAGGFAMAAGAACHVNACGCAKYMDDYKRLQNYQEKMKDSKVEEREELVEFKKSTRNLNTILAIRDTIVDTRNRYLTALKMQDEKIAEKQKKHADTLKSQIEDSVNQLKKHWPQVKASLSKGFEKEKKNPKFKQLKDKAQRVRTEGLSEKDKDFLRGKGLKPEQFEYVEEAARKQKDDEVFQDYVEKIKPMYDLALEAYDESLGEVKEIERIDSLTLNDKLRLLCREGLITAEEFNDRRDHLEQEVNYPIWEIRSIDLEHASKFVEKGIESTSDFLEKCRNKSDRIILARELDIDAKLIDNWVLIADLMRIRGIGNEYQLLLEDFGIKSVSDLAKSKEDILHKQLIKHIEKTNWGGELPTQELVGEWIVSAKDSMKTSTNI